MADGVDGSSPRDVDPDSIFPKIPDVIAGPAKPSVAPASADDEIDESLYVIPEGPELPVGRHADPGGGSEPTTRSTSNTPIYPFVGSYSTTIPIVDPATAPTTRMPKTGPSPSTARSASNTPVDPYGVTMPAFDPSAAPTTRMPKPGPSPSAVTTPAPAATTIPLSATTPAPRPGAGYKFLHSRVGQIIVAAGAVVLGVLTFNSFRTSDPVLTAQSGCDVDSARQVAQIALFESENDPNKAKERVQREWTQEPNHEKECTEAELRSGSAAALGYIELAVSGGVPTSEQEVSSTLPADPSTTSPTTTVDGRDSEPATSPEDTQDPELPEDGIYDVFCDNETQSIYWDDEVDPQPEGLPSFLESGKACGEGVGEKKVIVVARNTPEEKTVRVTGVREL